MGIFFRLIIFVMSTMFSHLSNIMQGEVVQQVLTFIRMGIWHEIRQQQLQIQMHHTHWFPLPILLITISENANRLVMHDIPVINLCWLSLTLLLSLKYLADISLITDSNISLWLMHSSFLISVLPPLDEAVIFIFNLWELFKHRWNFKRWQPMYPLSPLPHLSKTCRTQIIRSWGSISFWSHAFLHSFMYQR